MTILFTLVLAHLLSIILFLKGFFPTKPPLTVSSPLDANGPFHNNSIIENNASDFDAIVGPTVIMVIDALRADFVFPTSPREQGAKLMPFLKGLIESGEAMGYVARAHPPTVTLPRIKALMTGDVAGYVDVILNLGSSELLQDNVLDRALEKGLRIAFYGDDTWIRLFPRHFIRKEGTTSFFVTDYVEVDLNVTRHLDSELESNDWDILILHYLGLDHIGHFAGPRSPLVPPKLLEMDGIVERIYKSLRKGVNANPLLVICGDHGMSDSGSHGGASAAETRVPIILASPILVNNSPLPPQEILQIDLAPTLSFLIGLPIPNGNVGRMIRSAFSSLDWKHQLRYAYLNAYQLQLAAQQYSIVHSELTNVMKRHSLWLENYCFDFSGANNDSEDLCSDPNLISAAYYDVMGELSQIISEKSTNYDCYAMVVAIFLQWIALGSVLLNCLKVQLLVSINRQVSIIFLTLLAINFGLCNTSAGEGSCLCEIAPIFLVLVVIVCFLTAQMLSLMQKSLFSYRKLIENSAKDEFNCIFLWLVFGLLAQTVSLAASSFVEEEHQIWYFFTATSYLAILYHVYRIRTKDTSNERPWRMVSVRILLILVLLRFARVWNSTGDKWAHLPDFGDYLNEADNQLILSTTFTLALIILVVLRGYQKSMFLSSLLVLNAFLIIVYRIETKTLNFYVTTGLFSSSTVARLTFALILLTLPIGLRTGGTVTQTSGTVWVFMVALLLRPHNVPLLAIHVVLENLLSGFLVEVGISTKIVTILSIYMAQCSFFQMGNSNSLSSVDLTGGFVGLDSYNPVIIGILLFCSTYAGPIFWFISLNSSRYRQTRQSFQKESLISCCLLLASRIVPWAFYIVVCFMQRYHLFVWTVFSPKLLYEVASSLVILLVIFYSQVIAAFYTVLRIT